MIYPRIKHLIFSNSRRLRSIWPAKIMRMRLTIICNLGLASGHGSWLDDAHDDALNMMLMMRTSNLSLGLALTLTSSSNKTLSDGQRVAHRPTWGTEDQKSSCHVGMRDSGWKINKNMQKKRHRYAIFLCSLDSHHK